MYPSTDLDRWMFLRVLQGPGDFGGFMPRVSQAFSECQPLVIQTIMTTGKITVELSMDFFGKAIAAGHLHKKNPCPIWKITSGEFIGYGRTFAEAMCKLAICRTYKILPEPSPRP